MRAVDDALVLEEAKLICTSMMLQCLDRDHRLAFILGEVLDLSSDEAAAVLEIEPDAFRKRLSRARTRMDEFTRHNCGIANPANACRCGKQAGRAIAMGKVSPDRLTWIHRKKQTLVVRDHRDRACGRVVSDRAGGARGDRGGAPRVDRGGARDDPELAADIDLRVAE